MAPPTEVLHNVDLVVNTVNNSIDAFRDGLLSAVVGIVEDNATNLHLEALRKKDMKGLICMMCSPIENVHVAAQTVVVQAFDDVVSHPAGCFRALFSRIRRFVDFVIMWKVSTYMQ